MIRDNVFIPLLIKYNGYAIKNVPENQIVSPFKLNLESMIKTCNRETWITNQEIVETNKEFSSKKPELYCLAELVNNLEVTKYIMSNPYFYDLSQYGEIDYQYTPFLAALSIIIYYNYNYNNPLYQNIRWNLATERQQWFDFCNQYIDPDFAVKYRPSKWNPKNNSTIIDFNTIDFIVNEVFYVFDFMYRESNEQSALFILDTSSLDMFERKLGFPSLGAIAYFQLHAHRGFQMVKFNYNNATFHRNDRDDHRYSERDSNIIPLYCLWSGIFQYCTICSHAFESHFKIATQIYNINKSELAALSHPIRQALYFTELNANIVSFTSQLLILNNTGALHLGSNFTNNGILAMIAYFNKHKRNDIMQGNFFHALKLSKEDMGRYPISSYYRYFSLFKTFANEYVDIAYPRENDMYKDDDVCQWVQKVDDVIINPSGRLQETRTRRSVKTQKHKIKDIITGLYFNQIRHKMLSNTSLLYFAFIYPSITKIKDKYFIESTFLPIINAVYETSAPLISWTKNLSFLFSKKKFRNAYVKMHKGILRIEEEVLLNGTKFVGNLQPSKVAVSVSE